MMRTGIGGSTALLLAARAGQDDTMRLLLDHPSAAPAALVSTDGYSVLVEAAKFAVCGDGDESVDSFKPLLLLLRRVPVDPLACDAQQEHMTKVMEALFQGRQEDEDEDAEEWQEVRVNVFGVDMPDNARDECVRLMFEHGAGGYDPSSPVIRRIIREHAQLARVPQLLNVAVLGMAIKRQQQEQP
jgi:hypothetical protein